MPGLAGNLRLHIPPEEGKGRVIDARALALGVLLVPQALQPGLADGLPHGVQVHIADALVLKPGRTQLLPQEFRRVPEAVLIQPGGKTRPAVVAEGAALGPGKAPLTGADHIAVTLQQVAPVLAVHHAEGAGGYRLAAQRAVGHRVVAAPVRPAADSLQRPRVIGRAYQGILPVGEIQRANQQTLPALPVREHRQVIADPA